MAMHKVRTTMRPDEVIEVDDAELSTLTHYGVILKSSASTAEGARRAAVRQHAEKAGDDKPAA